MKASLKKLVAVALVGSLIGCAAKPYVPLVDLKGKNEDKYWEDLEECQTLSKQRGASGAVAKGGDIAGAGLGVLFALGGGTGRYGNRFNNVGAAGGVGEGAVTERDVKRNIIRVCMSNRGYSVLD